ncbi:GHMP kinase [Methyloceanibacter sp.]|uniref:GHMP family kinase ATP-binding protein n=1 Tax=Methyloceanibacter sp. TaxID=1965321 RepID=UPI002D1FA81D|nr:GHMP kinase [Methyloceanibacter sp.]
MQKSPAAVPQSTHNDPFSAVSVATTARLHFGFFDPSGKSSKPFGSFGLSLSEPWTRLTLRRASENAVHGPEAERAARYLDTIRTAHGIEQAYSLDIEAAIPSHAGLGSGTQLALAVGTAFGRLEGLDLSPPKIAALLERGTRSGIGIATFEVGGAILDSGPRDGALPQLVTRAAFPERWRALLIFDPEAKGLDGADELAAFETLPAYSEDERAALEARIVERALPALETADFGAFCDEVGHLQARMGAYFAPLQGGVFTSRRVAAVVAALRAAGARGLGQSSWGPTGFAFAETEADGLRLLDVASKADRNGTLRFVMARGRNEGAEITELSA